MKPATLILEISRPSTVRSYWPRAWCGIVTSSVESLSRVVLRMNESAVTTGKRCLLNAADLRMILEPATTRSASIPIGKFLELVTSLHETSARMKKPITTRQSIQQFRPCGERAPTLPAVVLAVKQKKGGPSRRPVPQSPSLPVPSYACACGLLNCRCGAGTGTPPSGKISRPSFRLPPRSAIASTSPRVSVGKKRI